MTDKIQSMSKGTEKLSERIHTVEFDNQNLLKSYDRLADRVSLQDGNLHAFQVKSKDEVLSLKEKLHTLESHVQNEDQRLGASMKSLEIYTGQEIQALQKTVVKRFETIEEIIGADEHGKKAQRQDSTLPVAVRDDLPRVLASYPVIYSDKASSSKGPKGSKEGRWIPIGMNDLKEIKQAVVTYGLHSTFLREMVKT